jgi:hypothetical protein
MMNILLALVMGLLAVWDLWFGTYQMVQQNYGSGAFMYFACVLCLLAMTAVMVRA